jgi:surface antigen
VLQGDGNLVVRGSSGQALWNSGTAGHSGDRLDITGAAVTIKSANGSTLWSQPAPASSSSGGPTLTKWAKTDHLHPDRGVRGVTYECLNPNYSAGYPCTPGYSGKNATGWAWKDYGCPPGHYYASGCPDTPHNCTLYVAFRLMQRGITLDWYANADDWAQKAYAHHVPVDQTPAAGAVAQWNLDTGEPGHVAYVDSVDATGITVTMDDYYTSQPWPDGYTAKVHIDFNSPAYPDNFIHF